MKCKTILHHIGTKDYSDYQPQHEVIVAVTIVYRCSLSNAYYYFAKVAENRHKKGSKGIVVNWRRVQDLLKIYAEGDFYPFSKVTLRMIESFKCFLLTAPRGGNKTGIISQNTAATYFGAGEKFRGKQRVA